MFKISKVIITKNKNNHKLLNIIFLLAICIFASNCYDETQKNIQIASLDKKPLETKSTPNENNSINKFEQIDSNQPAKKVLEIKTTCYGACGTNKYSDKLI